MLKPLIKVLRVSIICFAVLLGLGILFEFLVFPHSSLLQQLSIGAACSFIVVAISTFVQYKVEFERAHSNYVSATSALLLEMVLCQDDCFSHRQFKRTCNRLEKKFKEFINAESEVHYLTRKNDQKHSKENDPLKMIYINFLKTRVNSDQEALIVVQQKEKIINIIDTYIECWPQCSEMALIEKYKSWLGEDNSDKSKSPEQ